MFSDRRVHVLSNPSTIPIENSIKSVHSTLGGKYNSVNRLTNTSKRAMTFRYIVFAAVVCLASIVQHGDGYRILCVFPTPSISHQVVFRGLTLALNKRGHELVIVTPDPINDPTLKNYTEIDTRFEYDTIASTRLIEHRGHVRWMDRIKQITDRLYTLMERILDHPDLRKLYVPDSNEKFDLLMVEYLYWHSIYLLATRFNVPIIGISSLALNLNNHYTIGNPILASHFTNWELERDLYKPNSFWQRIKHFISTWKHLYWFRSVYVPGQEAIAKKYFGNDIPDLNDLEKNISLIFVNQQAPISYARPRIPKVIEIGGFHVSKNITKLPKDLQKILDEATEGFVYMSLGTNVKSNTLPNKTMNEFITAFSRLPYKVLWKFEDDNFPNKPDNVHVVKWVPQQGVLAHPNLKVFIYQGGVQSTEEAIHHAVPLIGFPVAYDQDMQVNKIVSLGVAKKLEITAVNENELFETIITIANDSSYKQRMQDLRSLVVDKPHDLLANAVWWTEYVIRHKGAPHLYSITADIPWYSRQDMDIVALISAGFLIVFGLTLLILYQLVALSINHTLNAGSLDAKKIN